MQVACAAWLVHCAPSWARLPLEPEQLRRRLQLPDASRLAAPEYVVQLEATAAQLVQAVRSRCPNALAAVLAVCGSVLPQVAATPAPAFAGHTPLTYAAQFDSAGPLRQLLEAGALPPERVSHSGAQQPLSVALRAGRGEQAVLLLQLGGDVSGMDERGLTLLHWAADKRCGWKWSSR